MLGSLHAQLQSEKKITELCIDKLQMELKHLHQINQDYQDRLTKLQLMIDLDGKSKTIIKKESPIENKITSENLNKLFHSQILYFNLHKLNVSGKPYCLTILFDQKIAVDQIQSIMGELDIFDEGVELAKIKNWYYFLQKGTDFKYLSTGALLAVNRITYRPSNICYKCRNLIVICNQCQSITPMMYHDKYIVLCQDHENCHHKSGYIDIPEHSFKSFSPDEVCHCS